MKASESSSTATFPPASRASSVARRPERFGLDGPSRTFDPRTHAYRKDVADVALAGALFAPHYARPEAAGICAESVMVRGQPSHDAAAVSQLVHGEGFAVLDLAAGWAWGKCAHDGYVGYLPAAALCPEEQAGWRVTAAAALVFAEPDIKAPTRACWPIGTRFAGEARDGFIVTSAGFVHHRHAAPLAAIQADPIAVAETLLGLPYLWGGRGGGGIDCSGLVQVALAAVGIAAPRDSDQQREALGTPLAQGAGPRRGDLVFLPGHVGLMTDADHLLHANAHWMAVTREPLAHVLARAGDDAAQAEIRRIA